MKEQITPNGNTPLKQRSCRKFETLTRWQAEQYRSAVDENKWYLGERMGRTVEWAEAEEDFLHNSYYGCAPKWRKEFCTNQCDHFSGCDLGRQLCKEKSNALST
ncbi:MAG TPA: hypothetical protein VIR63_01270 [Pontiella sp.]